LAGLDNWNDPKSVELRSNTGVTYKECMHHVESKRLPTLITKISENPEVNGIIPHLSGTMEHMKGLDLSVFRGKRIAVMGDSTLFYLVKWLYALVMKLKNEGADEPKYEEMRLSEASALVLQRLTEFGIVGRGAPPPIKISDGTVSWDHFLRKHHDLVVYHSTSPLPTHCLSCILSQFFSGLNGWVWLDLTHPC
jgi:hypothetical protein